MQQLNRVPLIIKKSTKGTIVYWNKDDLTFYIPKRRLPIPPPEVVHLTIAAAEEETETES